MEPITTAALISAGSGAMQSGGGFLQGHFNRKNARRNTDKTIAANRELAQYAYEQDLAQWHRQNEYNSPESQMARYREAGLNPNLIYGQGTSGNATSSPSYNPPKEQYNYEPFQVPRLETESMIRLFQDLQLKDAQVDNVKAHTNQVVQQTANDMITGRLLEHERETMRPYQASILHDQANISYNYAEEKAKTSLDRDKLELQRATVQRDLEALRKQWEEVGLTPQDKLYVRMLIKALPALGISTKEISRFLGTELYNNIFQPVKISWQKDGIKPYKK